MHKRMLVATFSFLLLSLIVLAYADETFTVPPSWQTTRAVSLKEGDSVTGSITVSGGSGNDINLYVTDPNGNTILRYNRATRTSFSFSASMTGTYKMHFDNSFSIISSKSVTLDYSVKTSILGIPQDMFLRLVGAIVIIGIVVVLLGRHKIASREKPPSAMKYCKHCGTQISQEALHCSNCGEKQ